MTSLPDFLLARIADDEAVALRHKGTAFFTYDRKPHANKMGGSIGYWLDDWQGQAFIDVTQHIARHDPARVLRECASKRAIVEYATNQHVDMVECLPILLLLAAPYSDHPDLKEEWSA